MLGDIHPTLLLNLAFHHSRLRPEIKLEIEYENEKINYTVTNISTYTAYQVYIYAKENHYEGSSIQLVAQVEDVLAPKETKKVHSYVQYPFVGCMSYKEYWVEFTDADGKYYRYTSGSDNTGIRLSSLKQIENRTLIIGKKTFKANRLKRFLNTAVYKIRYRIKS